MRYNKSFNFILLIRNLKIELIKEKAFLITRNVRKFLSKLKLKKSENFFSLSITSLSNLNHNINQYHEDEDKDKNKDKDKEKDKENPFYTSNEFSECKSSPLDNDYNNIKIINNNIINENSDNKLEDLNQSNYSSKVIDLVKIIQIYIYDKNNSINKFNYLLRLFNRWRRETFNSQKSINNNNYYNIDISKINTNSNQNNNEMILYSNLISNKNDFNLIESYSNYINTIKEKIERFLNILIKLALKDLLIIIKNNSNNDKNNNINIFQIKNNKYNEYEISKTNTLEICSFNLNYKLSSTNTNLDCINHNFSFNKNKTLIPPRFKEENEFFNTNKINKSNILENILRENNSINYNNSNNNNSKNDNRSNRSLISIGMDNNYKNKLNNKSSINKNVNFISFSNDNYNNNEIEEEDEMDNIKISCAIDIQNFWRNHLIQQYIKKYVKKLNIVKKFTKKNTNKLNNSVLFYFIQWRKCLKQEKILEYIIFIQKIFRKKLYKSKFVFRKDK
jgi:hypothetical protein